MSTCGIITAPKNHQRRRVDNPGQLADTLAAESLRQLRGVNYSRRAADLIVAAHQRERALKTGKPKPEAVFPSADGTLVEHLRPLGAWQ